ncbi:hypothetical protein [Halocatena salina]|uniref:Uncharacterized protein n=1 Tax=Halocatena salina TaxID=2934340 RepID=A0A8U0A2F7_9EURY|nr:hypothetical protein [Halocatena salina]UPM43355.1 hypothetical protein MW046_02640 [Halocatena salina]
MKDGNETKRKLTIVLLAIVGVSILLRRRGSDQTSETEEDEHEPTDTETVSEESTTSEPTSMTESITSNQRELDMFDMLAIFAAAITEARDEYHERTGR